MKQLLELSFSYSSLSPMTGAILAMGPGGRKTTL